MSYTDNYFLGKSFRDIYDNFRLNRLAKEMADEKAWYDYQVNLNDALNYRERTAKEAILKGIHPNIAEMQFARKVRDKIYAQNGNWVIAGMKWEAKYIKRFGVLLSEDMIDLRDKIEIFQKSEQREFPLFDNKLCAEKLKSGEMNLVFFRDGSRGDTHRTWMPIWADPNREEAQTEEYSTYLKNSFNNKTCYYEVGKKWFEEWKKLDFIPNIKISNPYENDEETLLIIGDKETLNNKASQKKAYMPIALFLCIMLFCLFAGNFF